MSISFPYNVHLEKFQWVNVHTSNPAQLYNGYVVSPELWDKLTNISEVKQILNEIKEKNRNVKTNTVKGH